ncbi:MAG: 2-oxoacid:acceptor oxidoreductase subunit alpha [Sedimenticola sp.]|nr:2-oxoacid:acceptor oxidoreductase subunit alpha [Sedimenticola sp.]
MDKRVEESALKTLSIGIVGSGGSGVVTLGKILLEAIARHGLYALMGRSSGPQIRGGESAIMLRIGSRPVEALDDSFDLLLALDWDNADRFADEIPISHDSLVLRDPDSGDVPPVYNLAPENHLLHPFRELAKRQPNGRANMVGLGILGNLIGLPETLLTEAATATLADKGAEAIEAACSCIREGYGQPLERQPGIGLEKPGQVTERWNISGNEASGYGALNGGVRFVAAYPITPASEILEWLAPSLEQVGGSLVQAEDELASINMVIGGSFGGVPSLTATSGPGLSLMMEGLGLAVASETPLVVANVMRGGPSTGIPTKSEQSDLNLALYGLHGDAPHLVLSALSIGDCAFTTQWAVQLAEQLQGVAIVLSDQSQGQARAIINPPAEPPPGSGRRIAQGDDAYQRYAITDDAVSPMAIPGNAECIFTADGLEHDARGTPSARAADHLEQLDKRRDKLTGFDYGDAWAESSGEGENLLVTWGSASGATREAAERLTRAGYPTRTLAVRLLSPLSRERFQEVIAGAHRVMVVEQNHGAQFYDYLNARRVLPQDAESMARPGPLPLRPNDIVNRFMQGV